VKILETERLILREIETQDAAFLLELLNSPKFLKYIGDRGVRTEAEAADFIEQRYRESYRVNGFGLYVVERSGDNVPVGICGFVKRDILEHPDLGFALLPQHEGRGYGTESARASMTHGVDRLGFTTVLAITSLDNQASGKLLEKLGFSFTEIIDGHAGEDLKLYTWHSST
jgi:RimJ/RimL family protein N-acetyltransferase